MERIHLPTGEEVLIDSADLELVSGFKWRALRLPTGRVYVHAWHLYLHVYMHRLVAGAGPNDVVDHHNRDTLDNRLANLRITGRPGNGANSVGQRRKRGKSSNYKGVFWDKARGRWMATIHTGGRTRSLGRYALEIDAARAYDLAAVEAWGSMARTNFPTEGAGGDLVDIAS